ncbi:DUF3427 domain-containing protein [Auraticoccus monumenti]|nr:DEAD/DEAH box helicase [Auraticoccus monumenti]
MDHGLYEALVTESLNERLAQLRDRDPSVSAVDAAEVPRVLSRHVAESVERVLRTVTSAERRLELVNRVLAVLEDAGTTVEGPARQLQAISYRDQFQAGPSTSVRPSTPLNDSALMTNSRGEPQLAAELRAEIDSSDQVDLLCAFVKWHGLRLLEQPLQRARERGVPIRVITTTYMGATERTALDRLVREFGASVKVHYDTRRTRLHAKAWMFHRATGYDTAYVGSSNLSTAALLDGVEWNVRVSRTSTPDLLTKFEATFESYWNDPGFESYDPDLHRERLDQALEEASGRRAHERVTLSISGLEVRPYPHQQAILQELDVARRVHDRHRNLVIAATGTGKTVVAALDYRRLCTDGRRPRLLFVAHRKEILEQSLRTYREVLGDGSFGELYVDGRRPEQWDHVFASIQSLGSLGPDTVPADHFEVLVIDEFHHAAAVTYRRVLDHFQPVETLGLTATPERTDGTDVRDLFDGVATSELRLWQALEAELLCPFHYFAVHDSTDLSQLTWRRGGYDTGQLEGVYTGNDARTRIVLRQLRDKVTDTGQMRALAFCVSVAHAEYMARALSDSGVEAVAVHGGTPGPRRQAAVEDLRQQRINVICTVEVFNEGVDIPEVDTVLLLRPTESTTVFLQQLGRGLRSTRDKDVLTVLDFVGKQRREFRYDLKLRALTGRSRRDLQRDIDEGFPFLPSGCQIILDRVSQELVLENLRQQLGQRWNQLISEVRSMANQRGDTPPLDIFLRDTGVELADVLHEGRHSWTELQRKAALPTPEGRIHEEALLKRTRALAHADDLERLQVYATLLDDPSFEPTNARERRLAAMLLFSLWPTGAPSPSVRQSLRMLEQEPAICAELRQVLDVALGQVAHVTTSLDGELADVPLQVHAQYSREEVLAALGFTPQWNHDEGRLPNSMREGVVYIPELHVDAFFITLNKTEGDYSPTTMYADYPISDTLFHWESQSRTAAASMTGRRYLKGRSHVLLFVRHTRKGEFGTNPYLFLGPATYVSHQGERPIAITWELQHPAPSDFLTSARVAVA